MKHYVSCLAIFVCLATGAFSAWKPSGEYDLSMGEIVPLCKMVKKFAETGKPPNPEPFDESAGNDPSKCIYFKWVQCDKPSSNPNKPCGWYEMKKCEGGRKKRSFAEYIARIKRWAGIGRPDGPVILGFPDDHDDFPGESVKVL